jgi:5'-3' exonuclease
MLVDINVLGFGAMRDYEFRHRTHRGHATGAILGTFKKLSKLLSENHNRIPVLLWDDRCHWREEIFPQYKRFRWKTAEQRAFLNSYLAQASVIQKLLRCIGVPQVSCPSFEADDIAGLICRHIDPDWQITLATTDCDWFQALRTNVVWISTTTGTTISESDLMSPTAVKDGPFFSVEHFVKAKALAGDPSDGIPGVDGVGLRTAARILKDHGSMEALWTKFDAGHPIKGVIMQRSAGTKYRNVYRRNLRLVDWRLAPPLSRDFLVEFAAPDPPAFRTLCTEWGLSDILPSWDGFQVPLLQGTIAVDTIRGILHAASS